MKYGKINAINARRIMWCLSRPPLSLGPGGRGEKLEYQVLNFKFTFSFIFNFKANYNFNFNDTFAFNSNSISKKKMKLRELNIMWCSRGDCFCHRHQGGRAGVGAQKIATMEFHFVAGGHFLLILPRFHLRKVIFSNWLLLFWEDWLLLTIFIRFLLGCSRRMWLGWVSCSLFPV